MPHHGHFVQSWLPVEDDNVPVTHVPFHLGRQCMGKVSVEKASQEGKDNGLTRSCRLKEMIVGAVALEKVTTLSLGQITGDWEQTDTEPTDLKELGLRNKPTDSNQK